jgi:hypothetical protein
LRVLGAVGAVAVLFASVAWAATGSARAGPWLGWTALRVPAEISAAVLDDGSPVFVVPHDGGGVRVLAAVAPHADAQVVWCPSDQTFWELGPASRFDVHGRRISGPAARGLTRYETVVVDGDTGRVVHVGPSRHGPGREAPALTPAGPECPAEVAADGTERLPDALAHDLEGLYGPAQRPEEVPADGRLRLLAARLVLAVDGSAALCTPRLEEGCPPSSPAVRSAFSPDRLDDWHGWVQGEVLARREPGGFTDVATVGAGHGEGSHQVTHTSVWGTVTGTLVAVQDAASGWVAVLDAPAQVEWLSDESGPPLRAARWRFADEALVADLTVEAVPAGTLRRDHFLPAEVSQRLTEGPRAAELIVGRDGVVRSAALDVEGSW